MAKQIKVLLGPKSYTIHIGAGIRRELPEILARTVPGHSALIVTQNEIWRKWGREFQVILNGAGVRTRIFKPPSKPSPEKTKTLDALKNMLRECTKLDKKGAGIVVIAFGGGTVGDLAGFGASVYKRGVPLIQVPTTLTAQVDSAIGGKTGVDLPEGKNLAGTFHQPLFVLSDPEFLKTLPEDIFRDGMGEVIKYAVIKDPRMFRILETRADAILARDAAQCEHLIHVCSRIKAQIVGRDEFDRKGVRAVLNFGHTLGHAIEAASGYNKISHGKAVAIGMVFATDLSRTLNLLKNREQTGRIKRLIASYGLPTAIPAGVRTDRLMNAVLFDKKRERGKNRLVLIKEIAQTILYSDVRTELIEQGVQALMKHDAKKKKGGLLDFILKKPAKTRKKEAAVAAVPAKQDDGSIAEVQGYYANIAVAIIRITNGELKLGNKIRFKPRRGSSFIVEVKSMQMHRKPVETAKKDQVVGLKVPRRTRRGDRVYPA